MLGPEWAPSSSLAPVAPLVVWTIQLDGGGSATLVRSSASGHVQHVNATSNFRLPWWERPVANHLGIIARPLGP
ncbi:phosphodiester glycosidase family protein [Pyxidicoccus caerfyrddinensis]|uniref:phosphodiester glycosidase family protein n=1 Tax=Pyxidicoccus caerfyrddinensis TaxID=2709663 RepID=UPI0013D8F31D|nr:phosphodiester glycosidase family protein [Pyxidicoccus caerfyrddinensis]